MFSDIYSYHGCSVSYINPLSKNFMKYCINITHHMLKTGFRRLKLSYVSAIPATTWSLVVYFSESVKILFLQPLLKVLVLTVCWLHDSSGILDKVFLSLSAFSSKSQPPREGFNKNPYIDPHCALASRVYILGYPCTEWPRPRAYSIFLHATKL